jgi:hypothetical protein
VSDGVDDFRFNRAARTFRQCPGMRYLSGPDSLSQRQPVALEQSKWRRQQNLVNNVCGCKVPGIGHKHSASAISNPVNISPDV